MKTKTIVHRSAAPIYAAAVTWLLYGLLFPLYQVGHFLLAAAASAVVAIVAQRFFRQAKDPFTLHLPPAGKIAFTIDADFAAANTALAKQCLGQLSLAIAGNSSDADNLPRPYSQRQTGNRQRAFVAGNAQIPQFQPWCQRLVYRWSIAVKSAGIRLPHHP